MEFLRRQQLRVGIEADLVRGREEQTAALLDARDWDYVVGSVHFLQDQAMDMRDSEWDIWDSADPDEVWTRYFQTLGHAASSGLFDILAHPDLVKVWGKGAPRPEGDPRRFYELALPAIEAADIAIEVSTAGLRKPVGEIYPDVEFLRMCLELGKPVALSSDAHVPEDLGHGYDQAVAFLREQGVTELATFSGRRRTMEPLGVSARTGIAYDSHRLDASRPLVLGGVQVPEAKRGLTGHSDADVLTHAVIDALLGAAGPGRHRPPLPRYRPAVQERRLDRAAGAGAFAARRRGADRGLRGRHGHRRGAQARSPPRRDARAPGRGAGRAHRPVNVKFTTNEGMGFVGRGEGMAAMAVATVETP